MSTTATTTPKLTKAEFARVHAKEYHAKRRVNGTQLSTATTAAVPAADPVAAALNRITASNETSYDAFVRSFGETEFIQRRDEDGQNELTIKQKQQSQLLNQKVLASSTSSTTPLVNTAPLPSFPSTSSPTTLSSSSDFLTLMRLLAEDKERLKGNTQLITGDEQEDERNQAAASNRSTTSPNTITAASIAAWQGDHIRVDDSYGFTADPFAPEAAAASATQTTESDDEEEAARVRVLGDDDDDRTETSERKSKIEDEEDEDDDPTKPSHSDPLESGLFLSEEDAGASLESVPVEAEYQYQADKDNLSLEQFRAARHQSTPQIEEITTESTPPLPTPVPSTSESTSARSNLSSSTAPSTVPPSFSARSASRLEADAIATARQHPLSTNSVLDEVETFHYQPDSLNEPAEREEKEEETNEIAAVQTALQSAMALQRASQLITPTAPHSSTTTATTHRITAISSSQSSIPTSTTRTISTVPPSAFSSSLGDSDVDDVELVDLDDEISTSVPILAKVTTITTTSSSISTTSTSHPPKSKVGNFLDLKDQLGFESDDEPQPDEEDDDEAS